jgi:hypothetical protein
MSLHRHPFLLAALAAGVGALPAAASVATTTTSHATLWRTTAGNVNCGIEGGSSGDLLCSNRLIPAPRHTNSKMGDPGFVTLGRTGDPTLIRTSQYSWKNMSDKFIKLAANSTWSLNGITCNIAANSIACTNASGHGFWAGVKWKSF